MKISQYQDGSKAIEIATNQDDDSIIDLQGDTAITTKNRDTGEQSTVMGISQHGGIDFTQRPKVAGVDVVLASDDFVNFETKRATIVDNSTTLIPLVPVQEIVTVLYSIQNTSCNEKGTITIMEGVTGYYVDVVSSAPIGKRSGVTFSATEQNGSLILNIIGNGQGLISDFKYRVNAVNTLYAQKGKKA